MAKPTYKLYYYNARGYAEAMRFAFKAYGQEFEDIRFADREDFLKKKDQFEGGVVPCLEIDGLEGGKVQIRQSLAILRYLGRVLNMYGENALQAAVIDTVIDDVVEFRQTMLSIFLERDEDKKAELLKSVGEEKLPAFTKKLEAILEKNGSKKAPAYFVGSKLSIADILVFDVFNGLSMRKDMKNILKDGTLIAEHNKTVMQNAGIAKWMEERPATEH